LPYIAFMFSIASFQQFVRLIGKTITEFERSIISTDQLTTLLIDYQMK
jgi:hypothetical protein